MIGYIWARESNQDDEELYSLKSQVDACRQAAAADGVPVTAEREFEVQFSGGDLRAIPELRQLRDMLERNSREKQRVYCYTQDRLIRGEEAEDIFYLLVEFRHFNAEVKFLRNPLDLTTIAGKIMALVAGHEASGEIDKIRDRTMRGKLQRVKEGKLPNYGPQKFGYRRVKETGKAEIELREWEILRRVKRLFLDERLGARAIAALFNREGVPTPMNLKFGRKSKWWHATIIEILRDEAYKGTGHALKLVATGYNTRQSRRRPREDWIEIPEAYPPLFTPEEWARVQAMIDANHRRPRPGARTPGILRGLAFCGLCGCRLYPTYSGRRKEDGSLTYPYYRCARGAQPEGAHPRVYNRFRIPDLDAWAWGRFSAWIRGESFADDLRRFQKDGLRDKLAAEAAEAEREIAAKARQLENLLGQARDVAPSTARLLHAEIERVDEERGAIADRLRRIERHLADEASRENLVDEILAIRRDLVGQLDSLDEEGRREALQAFLVEVFVAGDDREKWEFGSSLLAEVADRLQIESIRDFRRRIAGD